ncbi:MAG: hypothetical protein IBJ18_06415 [Phycisphaerales bacterium]|nr:hypothetical protein [Phycisphaerales bacterium]
MVELVSRPELGDMHVTRPLTRGVLGERWLVVHAGTQATSVLHVLQPFQGLEAVGGGGGDAGVIQTGVLGGAGSAVVEALSAEGDAFLAPFPGSEVPGHRLAGAIDPAAILAAIERVRGLKHAHMLEIERAWMDEQGRVCMLTPFTGDQDGLVPLDVLLRRRSGFLTLDEAKRAMDHLLSAVCAGHEQGLSHGEVSMREVMVDRRGSLLIEHYALAREIIGPATFVPGASPTNLAEDLARAKAAEVRSVLKIGYQLATGLRFEPPVIPVSRVELEADKTWDDLFETGLGTVGFTSAPHALSAVRGCVTSKANQGKKGFTLRSLLAIG